MEQLKLDPLRKEIIPLNNAQTEFTNRASPFLVLYLEQEEPLVLEHLHTFHSKIC